MYHVTLYRLDREVQSASADLESCELGRLSAGELTALLERFINLDAVENASADPEIRIEKGSERRVVKTGQKKLVISDARDRLAPGYVVTPAEVLADFERRVAPAAVAAAPEEAPAYVPPVAAPRRVWPAVALSMTLVVLLAALGLTWDRGDDSATDPARGLKPLEAPDLAAARLRMVGVFMTGSEPGRHGIALTEGGATKLFRLNDRAAPSVVFDTFRLARRGTVLVAVVERLGTVMEVTGADTLVYCGETYRRIP